MSATLPGLLVDLAGARPDDVALRHKQLGVWQETTWAEYLLEVERTALGLESLGVGPGDHVSILSDNRPEWVHADLAAQALGARSVGVYQTNPPADVAYVLSHSRSKVLICENQEQTDKAVEIAAETPSVEHVVVLDPRGTAGYADPRLLTWEELVARGEAKRTEAPDAIRQRIAALDPAAPSMVVYTSGTTGPPKGALLSSRNVLSLSAEAAPLLGVGPDDTLLSYLPLCHVAEKIFTLFLPLTVGAVVHFGESIETVREDLRAVSPTVFLGVPRIWEKMHASVTLKMRDSSWLKRSLFNLVGRLGPDIADRRRAGTLTLRDRVVWRIADLLILRPLQERLGLRRCRLPVSGAAPISKDLLRWFHGIGVPISEGYGQTECSGVSHLSAPDDIRLGSVGRALPGTEVRLAEDGEILVRGDHVFCGYLHDEAATRATVDEEGWLHTGDVGQVDDGHYHITGRKKEILVTSGGKNLSPEKIENAAKTSPYIKEAVAIGDGRKHVAALIQIDGDAVGDWASRRKITYTSYEDLAGKPEVAALVQAEIDKANELLVRVEQIRRFRILPKELHQDDGELTATQKVRRRQVLEIHAELVESLYGEAA
jgi:long-chain acyl-CoA synthetase